MTSPTAKAGARLGDFSLVFEPNLGQTNPQVRFLTRASGMIAFLTDRENVMVLSRRTDTPDPLNPHKTPEIDQAAVRMKLEGTRAPRVFEGLEKTESISNYFIGNDPSKWRPNIPNYRKVRAREVYEGIDLIYYGDGRKLEYDFVVRPGADPSQIRLVYDGADSLSTDGEGNLLIVTGLGTLVQRKPLVYQETVAGRREIEAAYTIRGGKVELALADWDRARELVIDPVLEYSTYLGGTGNDYGSQAAVDSARAAYVVGYTSSTDFPVVSPSQPANAGSNDVFVTKINPAGNGLVYSTYLGGSANDYGYGIEVDTGGVAYLTGATYSTDFPTSAGAFQTATSAIAASRGTGFVTKLNIAGGLGYSTYLGGTSGVGNSADISDGIGIDASGNAYVTGYTGSLDFPTTPGAFQTEHPGAALPRIASKASKGEIV